MTERPPILYPYTIIVQFRTKKTLFGVGQEYNEMIWCETTLAEIGSLLQADDLGIGDQYEMTKTANDLIFVVNDVDRGIKTLKQILTDKFDTYAWKIVTPIPNILAWQNWIGYWVRYPEGAVYDVNGWLSWPPTN